MAALASVLSPSRHVTTVICRNFLVNSNIPSFLENLIVRIPCQGLAADNRNVTVVNDLPEDREVTCGHHDYSLNVADFFF